MNTLIDLLNYGQSYWLDNLTREKISSGEIQHRVEKKGLRGITSNPSIFNKAISGSGTTYDTYISDLVTEGRTVEEIYDALTIRDVQDACDILSNVYSTSGGIDGFVSLEVPPYLSRDTAGTIKKARELFKKVGRPNCLIKVPGTKEGIPAIEQLLYEGIPINITLLFSVERYTEVAKVYLSALERRTAEGKPNNSVVSVASIFLSRIDTLTDQLLEQRRILSVEQTATNKENKLEGKAGVATAKLCYLRFRDIFTTPAWKKLEPSGARVQRLLWASTSNKDPLCDDLRYVEPLIGKDTVTTLPDETIELLAAQGNLKENTVQEGIAEAEELFIQLEKAGIDIDFITKQLEEEGIKKFADAYNELIANIAQRRMNTLGRVVSLQTINAGKLQPEFESALASIDNKQISHRLFAQDPYLWKKEGEQLEEIKHRLGWLSLPEHFLEHTNMLGDFSDEVKEDNFLYAVLLGMGGSSLCSEVARETYGTTAGYLQLFVLDNTSPEAILDLEKKLDLGKTLFIVASKSGNTQETLSFFYYFYEQLKKKNIKNPGTNFVAITDDGTPLVKLSEEYKFRKIFLNPPDLGGRYSVLSDFGLVPMALMGIDLDAFLARALQMEIACNGVPAAVNPGISLGVALGICQKHGRDKITFVLSSSIASFGYWVEQLLAESTGKEGKGLIPVNGEQVGDPGMYGDDRLFVHVSLESDADEGNKNKVSALEKAGHPVIRIGVPDKLALGGEYYRWEIAVAICGLVIGIDPFDQPNVEESKKNTADILNEWKKEGSFKISPPLLKNDSFEIYSGKKTAAILGEKATADAFVDAFTSLAGRGDYIALLPYFQLTPARSELMNNWRLYLRDKLHIATTLLEGPRYLHSTGQLHKGGPDSGLYILLVADEKERLDIPGEKFGFDVLHEAQGLGDFKSLDEKGRRVIRIHLGTDIDSGLHELLSLIKTSSKEPARQC